jgi:quinoprotein glucose dehydrogenase
MVVNSNRFATYARMLTRREADRRGLKPFGDYSNGNVGGDPAMAGTPYAATIRFWLSPIGAPCFAPPYGYLSAVDLKSGRLIWSQRFGTSRGSGPLEMDFPLALPMGAPNHGGSLVTRSGLIFIGASKDGEMHAYDLRTGRLLWHDRLPSAGQATPMTYGAGGRQFVVIAAGGSGALRTPLGSALVAYALPPSHAAHAR